MQYVNVTEVEMSRRGTQLVPPHFESCSFAKAMDESSPPIHLEASATGTYTRSQVESNGGLRNLQGVC